MAANSKPILAKLPIASLVLDPALQVRAGGENPDHVADLTDASKKKDLPRVKVVRVKGKGDCVYDGFHTILAYLANGKTHAPCEVKPGTWKDALLWAATANQHNALKLTRADKRRAVRMILEAKPAASNREIGKVLGVADTFVGDVRAAVEGKPKPPQGAVKPHPAGEEGPAKVAELEGEAEGWRGVALADFLDVSEDACRVIEGFGFATAGELYDWMRLGDTSDLRGVDWQRASAQLDIIRLARPAEPPKQRKAVPGAVPANGTPDFEWGSFEHPLGAMARAIDNLKRCRPAEFVDVEYQGMVRLLDELAASGLRVKKQLAKGRKS